MSKVLPLVLVLALPLTTHASVRINEIAWMGTALNANAEWIELINTNNTPVDLSGWTLAALDGTPSIKLSGTIVANGFYLLERTSDASVPQVAADQLYTGALENNGETLVLLDVASTTIDQVAAVSAWPGGNNETKQTAQRTEAGSWLTGVPTPRMQNVVASPQEVMKPSIPEKSSNQVQKVESALIQTTSSPNHEDLIAPTAPTEVGAVGAPSQHAVNTTFSFNTLLSSPWTWGFLGVLVFSAVALLAL